jgi:hypothetical protein
MRLLEIFTLLELKDRLSHVAQTMGRAITKRWGQHMNDAGVAGLPKDWRDILGSDILPDAMTMERFKEEWPQQSRSNSRNVSKACAHSIRRDFHCGPPRL